MTGGHVVMIVSRNVACAVSSWSERVAFSLANTLSRNVSASTSSCVVVGAVIFIDVISSSSGLFDNDEGTFGVAVC